VNEGKKTKTYSHTSWTKFYFVSAHLLFVWEHWFLCQVNFCLLWYLSELLNRWLEGLQVPVTHYYLCLCWHHQQHEGKLQDQECIPPDQEHFIFTDKQFEDGCTFFNNKSSEGIHSASWYIIFINQYYLIVLCLCQEVNWKDHCSWGQVIQYHWQCAGKDSEQRGYPSQSAMSHLTGKQLEDSWTHTLNTTFRHSLFCTLVCHFYYLLNLVSLTHSLLRFRWTDSRSNIWSHLVSHTLCVVSPSVVLYTMAEVSSYISHYIFISDFVPYRYWFNTQLFYTQQLRYILQILK